MAVLKTQQISFTNDYKDTIICKTVINVDKEGYFTTTLPKETVIVLQDAHVDLGENRMRTPGFFSNKNLDSLIQNVKDCFKEALSRTLTDEKIIIRYSINTVCTYIIDPETKEFVPNGYWLQTRQNSCFFQNGTKGGGTMGLENYGLQVYAQPFYKREYIYASGKQKTEYSHISNQDPYHSDFKTRPNLCWLTCVIRNQAAGKIQEIDYNEAIAKFFVDLHKAIFKINESIKENLDPESIRLIAENGLKLLS